MTHPLISFGQQYFRLSDGGSPVQFSKVCGLTSLSKTTTVQTRQVTRPDYDFPNTALAKTYTKVIGHRYSLNFSGFLLKTSKPVWDDWARTGDERTLRLVTNLPTENGGGFYAGPVVLTGLEETGSFGSAWRVSGSLDIQGAPDFTDITDYAADLVALYGDELSATLQALENAING